MSKTVGLTDKVVEFAPLSRGRCAFCQDETIVPDWQKDIKHHLIVTIDGDNHAHVHGPVNDPRVMELLISCAKQEMCKVNAAADEADKEIEDHFSKKEIKSRKVTTMQGEFYEVKQ